ncbi:MAG: hypothetical protein AB7L09_15450 [Nitrospira sp.]
MLAPATGRFLSVLKNFLVRTNTIADQGIRDGLAETLIKLGEILETHSGNENQIAMDTRLSDVGKDERIVELAKATLKRVLFVAQKAVDAQTAKARLEAVLFAVPDAPKGVNEIIQHLREAEIRTHLRSLEVGERFGEYLKALHAEDSTEATEVIRAVRLAPGVALIPEATRQKAERERVKAMKPVESTKLQSLEEAAEVLEALAEALLSWLRSYRAELPIGRPTITSGQYLMGYSDAITFPMLKDPVRT